MGWNMQQPQEWSRDETHGPSVATVFAVLALVGILVAAVVAIL
ncbi:MAG TPA: hypothetical protein VFT09_02055 [Ilumatobacteraceae bacterium]|nr:hypothetical protein [Ilumatobacteraceae bacterium]